jgi:hypothetical protein
MRDERIAAFWSWWAENRPRLDAMLDAGDETGLAEAITPAVAAIDERLVWEIEPGRTAAQALVVTAAGAPDVRPLAHRWVRQAPPADERWEFHPSRQPHPNAMELKVQAAGREFAFDQIVLGMRIPPGKPRLDLVVYHPIYPDLDDEARTESALLALDWILGEDEVARWIGDITAASFEPLDPVPVVHLPAVVAGLAQEHDEPRWVALEGRTPAGGKVTATARFPLRPVDFPLFDQHITVALPYKEADADGLPAGSSAEALDLFELELATTLPDDQALPAVQINADRVRVIHIYADPDAGVEGRVRELVKGWRQGRAQVEVESDPGWLSISQFLS